MGKWEKIVVRGAVKGNRTIPAAKGEQRAIKIFSAIRYNDSNTYERQKGKQRSGKANGNQ